MSPVMIVFGVLVRCSNVSVRMMSSCSWLAFCAFLGGMYMLAMCICLP